MDISASITISEPDPSWPHQFEVERDLFAKAFGGQLVNFQHIGSTAIPYLAARPILDVLVEVVNIDALASLEANWRRLKLIDEGSVGLVNYRFLRRQLPHVPMHLHLFEHGDPQIAHWLALHLFLKSNPAICALYGKLKKRLMIESKGDPIFYEKAKWRFLQQATAKSLIHCPFRQKAPKGLDRFLTAEQLSKRIWDNFSLFHQTLYRFCPSVQKLAYPGVTSYRHDLIDAALSRSWRLQFDSAESAGQWLRQLAKEMKAQSRPCSVWTSPFDTPAETGEPFKQLPFLLKQKRSIHIIPTLQFQVFDQSRVEFVRLLHRTDLYPWTKLLGEYYDQTYLHEFYSSLPDHLYAHGESIELYIVREGERVLAAFALHLYREGIGLVELVYDQKQTLIEILNFAIQRAHALNYHYLFAHTLEFQKSTLQSLGFRTLFSIMEYHYLG